MRRSLKARSGKQLTENMNIPLPTVMRSISLSLLLVCSLAPATDTLTWLPLTQTSPPSQVDTLRNNISAFVESARRKVIGAPAPVLTKSYFVNISPAAFNRKVLPVATSTNTDGTLACLLSAGQLQAFVQTIQESSDLMQFAAPGTMAVEGTKASMSVSRSILIDGANKSYGPTVDVIHRVYGNTIELRVIARVTQAVTNTTSAATSELSEHGPVTIRTVFQSGIDARVPTGGGLAVWSRAKGLDQDSCLMIICPTITTNFATPPVPQPNVRNDR